MCLGQCAVTACVGLGRAINGVWVSGHRASASPLLQARTLTSPCGLSGLVPTLSILQDDGTIGGRRYWAVGWAPEGGLCLTLAFLLTAELQQLREQFLLSVLLLQGAQVLHGGHR